MQRTLVDSGSFQIAKTQRLILEAYLGTCVGLTLTDRKAGIGGLYHILLPEPPSDSDYQKIVYAATGLPVFLKELLDRGASKSRLRAHVAGGALVTPAEEEDYVFNIGGHTFEIVESFLREEKIPIEHSETGGFFTCKMSLNLRTMETVVEPFGHSEKSIDISAIVKPSEKDILEVTTRIKPIPQIALKILNMLRSEDYDFSSIAEEIKKDQVLAAKVISFCQSPLLTRRYPISSIDRAVLYLGERRLLQTVLLAYCETIFACKVGGYSMCKGGLFNHAMVTAHLSEAFASAQNLPGDLAYTGGLLHDIGKIVLDHYVHPMAPYFYREVLVEGRPLIEVEKEVFGHTHTQAGEILAKAWSLPPDIVSVVRDHEDAESMEDLDPIVRIVAFANAVASRFAVGKTLSGIGVDSFRNFDAFMSIDKNQFYRAVEVSSTYGGGKMS